MCCLKLNNQESWISHELVLLYDTLVIACYVAHCRRYVFVTWRIAVMTSYNAMHMCMATLHSCYHMWLLSAKYDGHGWKMYMYSRYTIV